MDTFFSGLTDFYLNIRSNEKPNDIKVMYHNMLLMVMLITVIILLSFFLYFGADKFFELLTILSVISAYYLGGAAIGFIFAIPKSVQGRQKSPTVSSAINEPNAKTIATEESYNDNTNLEEISDWLTKIIVGVSLTQFNTLITWLNEAAVRIGSAIKTGHTGNGGHDYYVFSYAIIVFYFVAGLIIGYMWARIDFPKILTQNRQDLKKIHELVEQNSALRMQNNSIVNMINNPDSAISLSEVSPSEEVTDPALLKIIKKIVAERPIKDKKDLQKGRWGASISGNRQISAQVTPSTIPYLYKVRVVVKASANDPFRTPVAILLHDSFSPVVRLLNALGKTEVFVEIVAYEAFTVAAITEIESKSKFNSLELDLNDVPQLPSGFYWTEND